MWPGLSGLRREHVRQMLSELFHGNLVIQGACASDQHAELPGLLASW